MVKHSTAKYTDGEVLRSGPGKGWTVKLHERKSGANKGTTYATFFSPDGRTKCRSMAELQRLLAPPDGSPAKRRRISGKKTAVAAVNDVKEAGVAPLSTERDVDVPVGSIVDIDFNGEGWRATVLRRSHEASTADVRYFAKGAYKVTFENNVALSRITVIKLPSAPRGGRRRRAAAADDDGDEVEEAIALLLGPSTVSSGSAAVTAAPRRARVRKRAASHVRSTRLASAPSTTPTASTAAAAATATATTKASGLAHAELEPGCLVSVLFDDGSKNSRRWAAKVRRRRPTSCDIMYLPHNGNPATFEKKVSLDRIELTRADV